MKIWLASLLVLVPTALWSQTATDNNNLKIKYIDLIHCTHTDYGFTDHPYIARHLHELYLDVAIDAALATSNKKPEEQFGWTAEALDPVYQWWLKASPERRNDMLKVIQSGQLDITALPFNTEPFLNKKQWSAMQQWIPDSVWRLFHPLVAMQNDVNGFPRASAMACLDHNVKYLWMGINDYWGGKPFKEPYVFWWKMPDGRKILVLQTYMYADGYFFFAKNMWRMGDFQPRASDPAFWSPREGDILASDEKSVREANKVCIEKIKKLEKDGYPYDFLTFSFTNQWRCDNDCPFPALADFVATWTHLGLKPELRLTTASKAMQRVEAKIGSTAPVHEGEWLDWWAFGEACWPHEMSASRHAKRIMEAVNSHVWLPMGERGKKEAKEIIEDLCRFDEHTDGSNETMTDPYSLFNLGQITESAAPAYRSNERALWLLSQLTRTKFSNDPEGLYAINTSNLPYTGWVKFHAYTFRKVDYKSLLEVVSKKQYPIIFNQKEAKIWIENLPANGYLCFLPQMKSVDAVSLEAVALTVVTNENNWPEKLAWKGLKDTFDIKGIGSFLSVTIKGNQKEARHNLQKIRNIADEKTRNENRKSQLEETWATNTDKARVSENVNTISYTQSFSHLRLVKASRTIEIWKNEPRISVKIKFYRNTGETPEVYFAYFPFPQSQNLPLLSNGGVHFIPYKDQLPNTVMDFFPIDNWVKYSYPDGNWIWTTKELPLVTFGNHQVVAKLNKPPENTNKLYAMLYNNIWDVNFLIDQPGEMEFNFDIIWKDKSLDDMNIDNLVTTMQMEPVVFMNPAARENKFILDRLYKP